MLQIAKENYNLKVCALKVEVTKFQAQISPKGSLELLGPREPFRCF